MKHPQLKAEERTVLGKKVKKLRREGILPANVYGNGLASRAIQVPAVDFQKIYKEVGDTGLIDLTVDGKTKPVLVKSMQKNFALDVPLHVDFYQVNLKVKIKAIVPLTIVGEAQAVTDKLGVMLQSVSEVEVEALPEKLPDTIEVNVESLAEVGAQVTIGDLTVPEDVTVLTDDTQTVVKINELTVEEPEPEPEAEGEEGAEDKAGESEATEGETPVEGGSEENKA